MPRRRRKRIGEQLGIRHNARALRCVWGGWVEAHVAEKQACPAATRMISFASNLHRLSLVTCTVLVLHHGNFVSFGQLARRFASVRKQGCAPRLRAGQARWRGAGVAGEHGGCTGCAHKGAGCLEPLAVRDCSQQVLSRM